MIMLADNSRRIIGVLFKKYPRLPDEITDFECFNISTLRENFIHLSEEPDGDLTWLRI